VELVDIANEQILSLHLSFIWLLACSSELYSSLIFFSIACSASMYEGQYILKADVKAEH